MDQLVKYIAQNLVDNPDQVSVGTREKDKDTVIVLSVAPEDMGKVIGKQGRIAKAIRRIVKAASSSNDKNYIVEIE